MRCSHAPHQLLDMHPLHTAGTFLTGNGSCCACLYTIESQPYLDSLAHGMGSDGTFYIALAHMPEAIAGQAVSQARLDFTLLAPHADIRLTAASAHTLAEIIWIRPELVPGGYESLPSLIAEIACMPGAALGMVYATSMLVHDNSGITNVDFHTAIHVALDSPHNRELIEAMCAIDSAHAAAMVREIYAGERPGVIINEQATPPVCLPLSGSCYTVDANPLGLTLMMIEEEKTTVALAAFTDSRATYADFADELALWAI